MAKRLVALLAWALAPALVSAQGSPGDKCSMCEYIIEQCDGVIKAWGHMVPGGGNFPGTMDFGGGNVKGNYRVPYGGGGGAFISLEEEMTRRTRERQQKRRAGMSSRSSRSRTGQARTSSGKRRNLLRQHHPRGDLGTSSGGGGGGGGIDLENILEHQYDPLDSMDEAVARRDEGAAMDGLVEKLSGGTMRFTESTEGHAVPLPAYGKVPARTNKRPALSGKVSAHTQMMIEKSGDRADEFGVMYTKFMNCMENECGRMPKAWSSAACKPLFEKSDKLVEMYVHDYATWEICENIPDDKSSPCVSAKMFDVV